MQLFLIMFLTSHNEPLETCSVFAMNKFDFPLRRRKKLSFILPIHSNSADWETKTLETFEI